MGKSGKCPSFHRCASPVGDIEAEKNFNEGRGPAVAADNPSATIPVPDIDSNYLPAKLAGRVFAEVVHCQVGLNTKSL